MLFPGAKTLIRKPTTRKTTGGSCHRASRRLRLIRLTKSNNAAAQQPNSDNAPTYDLTNEFTLDEEHYTILLAHIPNREKFAAFGTDLALCGDTHGGQVRLPFIGPVYHQGAWFPRLLSDGAPLDDKGLFTEEDFRLFISSGLGNFPIPLRICNRPEIAVVRLEPAA